MQNSNVIPSEKCWSAPTLFPLNLKLTASGDSTPWAESLDANGFLS